MAYLQHTSWRDRPGAVIGVVAIHGVIGYALITGLTFDKIIDVVPKLEGYEVKVPLDPPPPPEPKPTTQPDAELTTPPLHAPTPPLNLPSERPPIATIPDIVPTPDYVPTPVPAPTPGPIARPSPRIDALPARPRNNPGSWVTEADYRSSWINREMTGSTRFKVEVNAAGRVERCTVTGSSGHPELDTATCDLVSKRARFDPAKDVTGAGTTGTYSSAVRWVLPE